VPGYVTVQPAYVLQYFDLVALLLLVIWSGSPLDGQASVQALIWRLQLR